MMKTNAMTAALALDIVKQYEAKQKAKLAENGERSTKEPVETRQMRRARQRKQAKLLVQKLREQAGHAR